MDGIVIMSKIEINDKFKISDTQLQEEYENRYKYGFFKRLSIERRYKKAYRQELEDAFNNAKVKH
jgi:hypothetical protein